MEKLFCAACVVLFSAHHVLGSGWQYTGKHGPEHWKQSDPVCGGQAQSPINIDRNAAVPDHSLKSFVLDGYDKSVKTVQVSNNGHSVKVALAEPYPKLYDEIGQEYKALQLHFHWRDTVGGSEHTVDGKHYPVEMHIVHMKSDYSAMDEVKDVRDGLLVVGVFLQPDASVTNSAYSKLLEVLPEFQGVATSVTSEVSLQDLLPSSRSYYRYYGSLTTPPCYESVKWTVMKEPVAVPDTLFSRLRDEVFQGPGPSKEARVAGNYRPIQPLNGRVVTEYTQPQNAGHGDKASHGWSYAGSADTTKWQHAATKQYPECGGETQSPLDIQTADLVNDMEPGMHLKPVVLSAEYKKATTGSLSNNGHTAKYALNEDGVHFSEADRTYQALQLHFHWAPVFFDAMNGESSFIGGSEHRVNGEHFPLEMHIVNQKLQGGLEDGTDDFGVLGVLFKASADDSKVDQAADDALHKITTHLLSIKHKGDSYDIVDGPILADLLPSKTSYYRYMGSLTTPPCTQAVLWTLFQTPVTVSNQRLYEFQRLQQSANDATPTVHSSVSAAGNMSSVYVSGNYRPTQKLFERSVYTYEEATSPAQVIFYVITIVVALSILAFGVFIYKRALSKSSSSGKGAKYAKGATTDEDLLNVNTEANTEVTNIA